MGADRIGSVGATNTNGEGARGSIRRDFCTAIFSRDLYLLWRRRKQQNLNRRNQ
jgi:hypothetical protein